MARIDSPQQLLLEERERSVRERLRIALWLCVFTTPVFAVVELALRPGGAFSPYEFVTLGQMIFLLVLAWFFTRPIVQNHLLWSALALTLELCFATAWAGVLRGDTAASPVMILLVVMASSILFPWGVAWQAALVVGGAFALLWNLGFLLGFAEATQQPVTWALGIGFGTSIMIAYWLEDSRKRVAQENFERRQVQNELHEAHARLERRVEERTASLLETNRRLEEEIGERQNAERQAQASLAAARSASAAKGQLLANMSHELRTPLSAVIGAMDMLLDSDLNSEQTSLAKMARRGGKSLLRLIGDLLDLSKFEAGNFGLRILPLDVAEVVEDLLESFAVEARSKMLDLRLEVEPSIPSSLIGDAERIRQVLSNFLSNALKFTASGSITVRVAHRSEEGGPVRVRFSVVDTGIGISEADHSRIFEPFVQVDGSSTRSRDGAGLGLSICRQLVEIMNGEIGVEGAPAGSGSLFWFELPLPRSQEFPSAVPGK